MAEQAVDLQSWFSNFRRHRGLLVVAAMLGAASGAAFVVALPPQYSSQSLVLLPPVQDTGSGTPARNVATEVKVASSDVVLGPAGKAVTPRMSTRKMGESVTITASTDDVLQIQALADTADRAEKLASAVAASELAYLEEAASSQSGAEAAALKERRADLEESLATVTAEIDVTRKRSEQEPPDSADGRADTTALAQLTAQQADLVLQLDQVKNKALGDDLGPSASIIETASPARRPGLVTRLALSMVLGAVAAVLVLGMVLGLLGSRDRRMRMRDEIADAIGGSVLASLRSRPQDSAAGWVSMLADYAPTSVDVLALRQMLRQLAPDETVERAQQMEIGEHRVLHPSSLTIVTLADDKQALAIGPQIAAFAASAGIRTRLVAGRSHESASALFAAFAPERAGQEIRPGLLLDTRVRRQKPDFTVVVAVVDRDDPDLRHVPRTAVTVLAVSSGAATAEELARAAVVADESGRLVSGVVVADPDVADRTTGRLLPHERAQQVSLPSRLTGISPSDRNDGTVTGLRGGA